MLAWNSLDGFPEISLVPGFYLLVEGSQFSIFYQVEVSPTTSSCSRGAQPPSSLASQYHLLFRSSALPSSPTPLVSRMLLAAWRGLWAVYGFSLGEERASLGSCRAEARLARGDKCGRVCGEEQGLEHPAASPPAGNMVHCSGLPSSPHLTGFLVLS